MFQQISWIRSNDLQILTSGPLSFTADYRYSSEYPHGGPNNWGLIIKNVRPTDNGQYECQINTEPKIKLNATLIVRPEHQQLMDTPFYGTVIDGPKKTIVKNGTTVNLYCTSTFSIVDVVKIDRQLIWSMADERITFQAARGGINIFTEWGGGLRSVSSNLTLVNVNEADSGIYNCSVTGNGSDFIELFVVGAVTVQSEAEEFITSQQENRSVRMPAVKSFVIEMIFVVLLLLLQ